MMSTRCCRKEYRKEYMSHSVEAGDISVTSLDDEEATSDGEYRDGQDWGRREPEITCRNTDHVNMLGLGIGFLSHIRVMDYSRQNRGSVNLQDTTHFRPMENGRRDGKGGFVRLEVVTASLGFLTNFEDVYKLWAFVAKFLNPAFIREGSLPTVQQGFET